MRDQRETEVLAQVLALKLRAGDVVALYGDLGAGKTTFARQLIRSVVGTDDLEVPSPTYAIQQVYDGERFAIRHYDFYRLAGSDDVSELGFDDDLSQVVSIIEWPDRAEDILPVDHIAITIDDDGDGDERRRLSIAAGTQTASRIARARDTWAFLVDWSTARDTHVSDLAIGYLQGDASARSYARLRDGARTWLLMDSPRQPDGPPIRDGRPYSAIAHLAEDIQAFVAIGGELSQAGFSTPKTERVDPRAGFAIIEDLGDSVFGTEIARGGDLATLYEAATNVAIALRDVPVPEVAAAAGCRHHLPRYTSEALHIEVELLLDWYVPCAIEGHLDDAARRAFHDAWQPQFARLQSGGLGWVLRDFHSPNLIHLPQRSGIAAIGLIDYQDAVIGHTAYDLVSLLQDARLDVPADIEAKLLERYCRTVAGKDDHFDETEFRWAYALLGGQRNTKILGIFARLARRDGKTSIPSSHSADIWLFAPGRSASRTCRNQVLVSHVSAVGSARRNLNQSARRRRRSRGDNDSANHNRHGAGSRIWYAHAPLDVGTAQAADRTRRTNAARPRHRPSRSRRCFKGCGQCSLSRQPDRICARGANLAKDRDFR